MDHNLEDSLNLESAIGEMDFEHAGDVVVSQADITLDTGTHDEEIPMEFENMEEQPMLMDTGKEEIIVSDFMSDQFSLQEYSVQDDQTTTATITEESNQQSVLTSQSDPLINLQFDSQTVVPIKKETQIQPKYIAVKAAPMRAAKKLEASLVAAAPRQVAIAPKPAAPAALLGAAQRLPRLPLAGVLHAPAAHSNTVLAQIGKRLVVMPSGHQKIKLVTSGSGSVQYIKANTSQGQLITAKSGLQGAKPIMAKVMVQGQSNADLTNQQTVITKILPSTSATTPQARYVMQQKTVPISLGQKVLLASPTKQGVKFTKKQQIISIKSPTPKLMPAPAQGTTTKKVVITANPAQNVILKTTAPPKAAQITKDGKVVVQGQRSQLHQINVPGKGIQYIRLITNQPSDTKTVTVNKPQPTATTLASKSFLLTDSKGNVIHMTAEKMSSGQPPPLVFTGNLNKWQQKLVRIAPAPVKSSTVTPATSRASQSLLAPLSPLTSAVKLEDASTDSAPAADELTEEETEMEERSEAEEYGRGARAERALHALVADAVAGPRDGQLYDQPESPEQDENADGMEHLESGENLEEQLIVIPPNYIKSDVSAQNEYRQEESEGLDNMLSMDAEENSYLTPRSPQAADCDVITSELGLRPRRACNCTKSQCLKLYCDCFANGEFCNRCNCNNCYNNLNYEELRQKAIRTCLERNPNAFRPKIGKSKTGGPDIIRRHNKGCNCKRSGCLKNYCECYEAKIACTAMCKCFGCRNVEETLHRARRREPLPHPLYRPPPIVDLKQPCSFMTTEVIEAVCQCLIAASVDGGGADKPPDVEPDPVRDVIDEFSRCLQDIISASHQAGPLSMLDEGHT